MKKKLEEELQPLAEAIAGQEAPLPAKEATAAQETPPPAEEAIAAREGRPEEAGAEGDPPDAAGELEKLKAQIELRNNVQQEIRLLKELFPRLDADDIPDQIWQECENGKGIAAQYALHFIQAMKRQAQAESVNDKNARSAPPKIAHDGGGEVFFTPEMVKRMSQREVRKNYPAIMSSMEKWK